MCYRLLPSCAFLALLFFLYRLIEKAVIIELFLSAKEKVIVFNLSGTGYFDLYAYKAFNDGTMGDYIPTDEEINTALERLPKV